MGFFALRPPVRLGTRIALMTLIALLAVQAMNAAIFFLLPPPHLPVYGALWLIEKIEESVPPIFAAQDSDRPRLAEQAGAQDNLRIRWRPSNQIQLEPPTYAFSILDRIQVSLENDLRDKVRTVVVRQHGGPPGPVPFDGRPVPPEFKKQQLPERPIKLDESESVLFGHFEVLIQGLDESWVSIEPRWRPRFSSFMHPWFITLIGAVILVSALSALTATRSLRPLNRLIEAAERLGRTRETTAIDARGLNEFGIIADALNEMQTRIKQFLDERTQMLAAISHDLRTSLTRLRLEAEELPESQTKNRLIVDVSEMERMISATLSFAGNELKSEPQQRVDLAALLISLCDSFSDYGQPADYSGPNHANLFCQPVAMKRAFDNLIGNAIKYGSRASVTLTLENGALIVSITDDGPGIPPDKVELAFRPFQRIETSRNRETGGVGLGMPIARDIIRAHGGEISLRNRPEGGLEVLVRLPPQPPATVRH